MIRHFTLLLLFIFLNCIHAQANTTSYTYDDLGRIKKSTSTADGYQLSYAFTYDAVGNMMSVDVASIIKRAETLQSRTTEIYVATFGRAPDRAGLQYWVGQVEKGLLTVDQVAQSFFDQPETQTKYPQGTSNADFITSIYQNVLNRDPDQAGLDYWVAELDRGAFTRSQAIIAIINGAKAATGSPTDAAILANKEEVGEYFAASSLGELSDISTLRMYAQMVMGSVDSSTESVSLAKTYIDILGPGNYWESQMAYSSSAPIYSLSDLDGSWFLHGLYAGDTANSFGWQSLTLVVGNGNWQSLDQVNWEGSKADDSGTMSISTDGVTVNEAYNGIMNDDRNIIVATGTSYEGTPGLSVSIKSTEAFSPSDIAGTWQAHILHVGEGSNGNGWTYATWTIDSNGNTKSSNLVSSLAGIGNFTNGALTINVQGIVTADNIHGAISPDKNFIVLTHSDSDGTSAYYDMIILTRTGAAFTQDDLTGDWVMHALMAKHGKNRWAYGNAAFDSQGNLSYNEVTTSNASTLTDVGQAVVASTGVVTFSGIQNVHGALTSDKKILVLVGNTNQGSERTMLIYIKR